MGAEEFLAVLIFVSGLFQQVAGAPPRDVASLLEPKMTLTKMEAKTDEDSLIALFAEQAKAPGPTKAEIEQALTDLGANDFQTRQKAAANLLSMGQAAREVLDRGAKSDDPEVRLKCAELLKRLNTLAAQGERDTNYVRKLMAIRALEQMNSQKAVPTLEAITRGTDITLADAAQQAISVIQGKQIVRPTCKELLKKGSAMLPADTGFVAILDLQRNSRTLSLRDATVLMTAAIVKKDLLALKAAAEVEIDKKFLEEAETGLVDFLSQVGNVRVDAVIMATSTQLPDDGSWVAFIFKGLGDPARINAALDAEYDEEYEWKQRRVFTTDESAACVLDPNTFVLVFGPDMEAKPIDRILEALTSEVKVAQRPPVFQSFDKAFALVLDKQMRLAAAGAFSEIQKNEMRAVIGEVNQRLAQEDMTRRGMVMALLKIGACLSDTNEFLAWLDPDGKLVFQVACANKEVAEKLDGSVRQLRDELKLAFAAGATQEPEATKAVIKEVEKNVGYWETTLKDAEVRIQTDPAVFVVIGMVGSMIF